MLGTLVAEAEITPDFAINRTNVLGNVGVIILRNPATYSHLVDNVKDSIHSGKYRLLGYKHEITNTFAKTTLGIHKISLGDIE